MENILKIGVDEAGRGPLAGPVVASAVIISKKIIGVKDSKKIPEKKREELFLQIIKEAEAIGVGVATVEEIEQFNILNATFLAMRRAIESLLISYRKKYKHEKLNVFVLVDGNRLIPNLPYEEEAIIDGDSKIYEISCASIVAKVYRDRIMEQLSKSYPQYHFERNKGYGTKDHIEAILRYGVTPIHRKKFLRNIEHELLFR